MEAARWLSADPAVLWLHFVVAMAESAESMDSALEASEINAGARPLAHLASLMRARRPEMPSLRVCSRWLQRFAERARWQGCCFGAGGQSAPANNSG